MVTSYSKMKKILKAEDINTKYFTKSFYNTFTTEYANEYNDYLQTQQTDFYNKASTDYCKFLEQFHSIHQKYILDIHNDKGEFINKRCIIVKHLSELDDYINFLSLDGYVVIVK